MSFYLNDDDTICALATPNGIGGISVIRVSGTKAIEATRKLAPFLPQNLESHKAYFGAFQDALSDVVDEGLITVFLDGRSYTGELVCEISCHGNPLIVKEILDFLLQNKIRLAQPGEFTLRAFMNGKIDLVQAESVLSLIQASSRKSKSQALKQLKGHLSQELSKITDDLIKVLSILEASIDFTTEDIDVLPVEDILIILKKTLLQTEKLLSSYQGGKILKEGYQVAIIGRANVGKSSLLNALMETDKAIVSPFAGTTRDIVEGEIILNGCCIKLIDTAGLRLARGVVEKIGVERARQAISDADLLIFLTDVKKGSPYKILNEDQNILSSLPSKPIIKVRSKKDLWKEEAVLFKGELPISSHTREGMENLKTELSKKLESELQESPLMILQLRQFESLKVVKEGLLKGIKLLKKDESLELIALELQVALKALFEILGKEFNDEIMDRVFKEFCIGK